jgi:hypothetical protein
MKEEISLALSQAKKKAGAAAVWLLSAVKKRYKAAVAVLLSAALITATVITIPFTVYIQLRSVSGKINPVTFVAIPA